MRLLPLASRALGLLALAAATTSSAPPQQGTTGLAWMNNFCVGPLQSMATGCYFAPLTGGGPLFLTIETSAPNLPVFVFFSGPNPCLDGLICLPPSSAPIAFTACAGSSNQSIDIIPSAAPPLTGVSSPAGPNAGVVSIQVDLPPGIGFSTQAVVLDPVNGVPFGSGGLKILTTQSYQVQT